MADYFYIVPNSVTAIAVSPTSKSLEEEETQELTVTITPSNADNQKVIYSSSDEEVATVSDEGVVTAVKKGSATITVTSVDMGKTATCSITVTEKED